MKNDERLAEIIRDALRRAKAIRCPVDTFVDALESWKDEIEAEISAAEQVAGPYAEDDRTRD